VENRISELEDKIIFKKKKAEFLNNSRAMKVICKNLATRSKNQT
jgi:hypothetical protein